MSKTTNTGEKVVKVKKETVSVNQFEKFVKTFNTDLIKVDAIDEYDLNLINLSFSIKKYISLQEVAEFVNSVVVNCFNDDDYVPYCKDFIYKRNLIKYFTNITLPSDSQKLYEWLQISHISETIEGNLENCHNTQLSEIKTAIDEMIEFKKQEILANKQIPVETPMDNLIAEITSLTVMIKDKFKDINFSEVLPLVKSILPLLPTMIKDGVCNKDAFVETILNMFSEKVEESDVNEDEEIKAEISI